MEHSVTVGPPTITTLGLPTPYYWTRPVLWVTVRYLRLWWWVGGRSLHRSYTHARWQSKCSLSRRLCWLCPSRTSHEVVAATRHPDDWLATNGPVYSSSSQATRPPSSSTRPLQTCPEPSRTVFDRRLTLCHGRAVSAVDVRWRCVSWSWAVEQTTTRRTSGVVIVSTCSAGELRTSAWRRRLTVTLCAGSPQVHRRRCFDEDRRRRRRRWCRQTTRSARTATRTHHRCHLIRSSTPAAQVDALGPRALLQTVAFCRPENSSVAPNQSPVVENMYFTLFKIKKTCLKWRQKLRKFYSTDLTWPSPSVFTFYLDVYQITSLHCGLWNTYTTIL